MSGKNREEMRKPGLISFDNITEADAMVNATTMAKQFNKKPTDWLRLKSVKNFLSGLAEARGVSPGSLIIKAKKESKEETNAIWIHEDVALEFARWLSPSFAIWNNRHTKKLLLNGKTETCTAADTLPVLTSALLQQVKLTDELADDQLRKALYHDAVLQSRTLIPATLIAKELGMSAIALNRMLHEKKIIYKSDSHWFLYADYQGKGYTGTKTALYIDSQGKFQSNIHTYWTEKGREFIHELVRQTKLIA